MSQTSDRGASVAGRVTLPERYEPIRRIASGGMATVWCAHDRTLDRRVAIKLLATPFANDELAGRRFTREARTAARLSAHTNVVTIYDVGQTLPSDDIPSGRPFLVMEYLAGGTVADALKTGEFGQPMTVRWLREAAMALDFAHRRGVIHRDVKLSNFLLNCAWTLHVADFGIAQLGSEDTLGSGGQLIGTAAYLAPERALGLPATEASDRYSLAVAAFELLVGERPFAGAHFTAQARQHVEEPPPRASERNGNLPAALDAVLARGMAKHAEERFGTASELVDEIERALAPVPLRRRPAAAAPATAQVRVYGRRANRGRIAALAAMVAVLLGIAIAAGAAILPGTPQRASARNTGGLYAEHRAGATRRSSAASAGRPSPSAPATKTAPATQASPSAPAPANGSSAPTQAAAGPGPGSAAALEAQGHELMAGGDYHTAIKVLRQVVSTAPRSSLTYAYALFDLGRSLRLAGDPRAAVSVLWRRLQIPNQTDVVRGELTLALPALGQQASSANAPGTPLAARPSGGGAHQDGSPVNAGASQGD